MITFKADLLYGATGTRKTTNVGLAAAWFHAHTGRRTRLITADPGGFDPIRSLVESGIIEPWVISVRENPIESLDLACQGYWPVDPEDPRSALRRTSPEVLAQIALYAIEGLTSAGDMILKRLRDTRAQLSQKPSYIWQDGAASYVGANESYYGFTQDRLYDFVMKSHLLPVGRVLWTALEGKGEYQGAPVYGPAIAGKKAIAKAGQWFGNTLHMEMLTAELEELVELGGKKVKQILVRCEPVLYLQNHADPITRVVFPAKTRAPYIVAARVPYRMVPDLGKFYQMLDDLRREALPPAPAAAT